VSTSATTALEPTDAVPDPIVELLNVYRTFPGDRGVRDLTMAVPAGSIFGLVGPSGAGKTTTVRLLLGTDVPDEGEVRVLGGPPSEFRREDRRGIGYLPQQAALYPELSVRHNLNLMASLYGMPWRSRFWPSGKRGAAARRRIADVLDFVDLTDRQKVKMRDASGGEQRRLGLAAALVHDPALLILDEPTAGIDPVLRRKIWDRLRTLNEGGTTLIVTTQYVEEAANCDLVAFLIAGQLAVIDTPDGLRQRAYGDYLPEDHTLDDVFVTLLERYQAEADGDAVEGGR
jgi:ABC-2 type transport system ATP-binding protein